MKNKANSIVRMALLALLLTVGIQANAQVGVAVVDRDGEIVGELIDESDTQYRIQEVEGIWIDKEPGMRLVVKTAYRGDGWLYPSCEGNVNVRQKPTTQSAVVASWKNPGIDVAQSLWYKCLGKEGQWYKLKTEKDIVGYVREDLVLWAVETIEF